ncbi:hypothetical protein ACQPZP_11910 [Spirillospora sp. CA-142024]|uniref:hypothetical protein n=1 Tax=Spirillospora sp. CA-142024 TaxID=3240036 RepID=UPI003D9437DF
MIGEERLCWMRVSGFREVPGFGDLPHGRVQAGHLPRGARARLLRGGVLIAEDLRAGALVREKIIGTRLEARERVGEFRRVAVATGHGGVRADDHIEVYTRAEPAEADRHRAGESALGRATVRETTGDPLAGPGARVDTAEGRLRAGDRVRIVRGGRPVAEALRLLLLADEAGAPAGELAAGGRGSLYLGHPDLRPGDTVLAYGVPAPEWTEARTPTLSVTDIASAGATTRAAVLPIRSYGTPSKDGTEGLAAGHRARVLRDKTVLADGLTIGGVSTQGLFEQAIRADSDYKMNVAIDFPDLREGDWIEPYRVLPARGVTARESPPRGGRRAFVRDVRRGRTS